MKLNAHALFVRYAQVYRLDFQDVAYGTMFHQCVYVRCKSTGSAMDAAKRTRQAFGHPADTQYMPHVSLLYSDIPSEIRCILLEDSALPVVFVVATCHMQHVCCQDLPMHLSDCQGRGCGEGAAAYVQRSQLACIRL